MHTVKFYMSSGQIITITDVDTIKMKHDTENGNFNAYEIVWAKNKPPLFSLNLNCVEAVIMELTKPNY